MAIAFSRVSVHSRSKGHSAVAGAAYRAGISLFDERTQETHDFSNKAEVTYSEILLPEGADKQFKDRAFLWNQVEKAERRKDAQVAKDIVLALPKEVDRAMHIDLARQFAQDHFVRHGLVADIAIHDHGDGNPHAHLYVTTRRLMGNSFGQKARDLNPDFARGRVASQDYWGDKWREQQDAFFKKHGVDLEVDANHLISQRHEGRLRGKGAHYLREENKERRAASVEIALTDPTSVLNMLARTKGVFTEKDIAKVIFKNTDTQEQYQQAMNKTLAHRELVGLGTKIDGQMRYTTRSHFYREANMQDHAQILNARYTHGVEKKLVEKSIQKMQLRPEQGAALRHLAESSDMAVVIGRAGSGKSYLMKAANEAWVASGYRVRGISVSGIAAKGLESSSGIRSFTLASFKNQVAYAKDASTVLNSNDILVMDEAGMTDTYDMSLIVEMAKASGCKLVLVGDEAQLQPIGAGAPLRALTVEVGFAELSSIMRQRDSDDRTASQSLAKGDIDAALSHYEKKGALHWHNTEVETQQGLVDCWAKGLNSENISQRLILAHRNVDVDALNQRAREAAIEGGWVSSDERLYRGFEDIPLALAPGDRLLFRKNDKELGVANGEFATISEVKTNQLVVKMNDRVLTINTKDYSHFAYGYAATVHKAQGVTVDHSYVYTGGKGWNRHLAYVALTRHRDTLSVFADRGLHRNERGLKYTLSRHEVKDNVLDFPISFSIRRGFNPERVIGRFVERVSSMKEKVKDNWKYLVNYEREQKVKHRKADREKPARSAQQDKVQVKEQGIDWKELQGVKHRNLDHLQKLHERMGRATGQRRGVLQQEYRSIVGRIIQNPRLMNSIVKQSPRSAIALKQQAKAFQLEKGHERGR